MCAKASAAGLLRPNKRLATFKLAAPPQITDAPTIPRLSSHARVVFQHLRRAPCIQPPASGLRLARHLPSPTRGLLNGGSPLFIRQPLGIRQPWLHHHTSFMAYHHLQCLIWTTMPYLRPCNLSYTPAAFWRFTGVLIGVRSQNCCPLCHNVGWSCPSYSNPLFLPLISWLVDCFNPSDKYESQLGWWHSQLNGKW